MDQIETLLERAKELHQQGDIDGALSSTYEAVNHLTKEFRTLHNTPKAAIFAELETTPC